MFVTVQGLRILIINMAKWTSYILNFNWKYLNL